MRGKALYVLSQTRAESAMVIVLKLNMLLV